MISSAFSFPIGDISLWPNSLLLWSPFSLMHFPYASLLCHDCKWRRAHQKKNTEGEILLPSSVCWYSIHSQSPFTVSKTPVGWEESILYPWLVWERISQIFGAAVQPEWPFWASEATSSHTEWFHISFQAPEWQLVNVSIPSWLPWALLICSLCRAAFCFSVCLLIFTQFTGNCLSMWCTCIYRRHVWEKSWTKKADSRERDGREGNPNLE